MESENSSVIKCPICRVFYTDRNTNSYVHFLAPISYCLLCRESLIDAVVTDCDHYLCVHCWDEYKNSQTNFIGIYDEFFSDEHDDDQEFSEENISLIRDSTCPWENISDSYTEPCKPFDEYILEGKWCGWCNLEARSWVRNIGPRGKWHACCANPTD